MNNAFTIFGGSGDLTYRKLLPALYKISLELSDKELFPIITVGRKKYSSEEYMEIAKPWVKQAHPKFTEEHFARFVKQIEYFQMDMEQQEEYTNLKKYYEVRGITEHVFYFAVAPKLFLPITLGLKQFHVSGHAKVIIEKPFGENLATATELNHIMEDVFQKENLFHIDHYLGKEMVQSIQSIRFKNVIFKGIWNKDFIENVQISTYESVGVETRGGYYDDSGALKDMVQNHLLQVLSIVAMEQPQFGNSEDFQEKQLDVFQSLIPIAQHQLNDHIVLGQYAGYTLEPKVKPDSKTETYVALKLLIDNERWKGVPFYIRTGKKLRKRETEVVIQFKQVDEDVEGNVLIIKIQPNEGVYFRFHTKKPGITNDVMTVSMNFCQNCIIENRINTPEAYERLLKAALKGDHTLFSRWDQIVTSWQYVDDLVNKMKTSHHPVVRYSVDTLGPIEADMMLQRKGHYWFNSDIMEE